MFQFLKSWWVLLVVVTLFILFKIHHLAYPYYWDESWPYAAAVADMYRHGISLVPGSVDPELSRGHPLFFHAVAALWGKVFGMSHVSMHSFGLTISMLFLIAVYEVCRRLFNVRVAIMSLLLVSTQVLFIVQSSYLLLEMLVALLAFMSLYHYIRGNFIQTCLYLSALFYTKESGLIMGFVLGIDALLRLRGLGKDTWKENAGRLLSIGIPCILMGVFFLLQKHINGWYILPLYTQLVEHTWSNFWHTFSKNVVSCMFVSDYRFWYFIIAAALTTYTAIRKKAYGLLTFIIPMLLVFFMTVEQGPKGYWDSLIHFCGLVVSMLVAVYFIARPSLFPVLIQRRFIVLWGCFIVCFLVFSALNFFTYRYLLATIIPALCLVAVITDKMTESAKPGLFYTVLAAMMGVSAYAYVHDDGNGDTDRSCFSIMKMQQGVVDYLEQHNEYSAAISANSFLHREHLIDPTTGYLRGSKVFTNVKWDIDGNTQYIIVDNIEGDSRYEWIKQQPYYRLVYRMEMGGRWVELYGR